MGFSEGFEDEFLLTCFVCKEPFGMLAAFCGGCGARRDQAMGIERAKATQQITQNVIQTPSLSQTFAATSTPNSYDTDALSSSAVLGTSAGEKPAKAKKTKKTSIRRQIFFSNMRLRIEAVNTWQSNHARKLNYLGGLFFIGVTYLFIQSFIVGTSNPELAAERYVKAAITRDDAFFDINNDFKDSKKLEVFPVKYTKGINASDWLNFSDIRGLSGTAEVTVTPADSRFDQTPVIFKMKAQYKTVLGIFREPIWVPAEPTATITIDYPNSGNALIYINGYMAGTTSNPAVKEGTYHIYPGRLEVTFYVDGEETNDGFSYFIQPSGDYKSN